MIRAWVIVSMLIAMAYGLYGLHQALTEPKMQPARQSMLVFSGMAIIGPAIVIAWTLL